MLVFEITVDLVVVEVVSEAPEELEDGWLEVIMDEEGLGASGIDEEGASVVVREDEVLVNVWLVELDTTVELDEALGLEEEDDEDS